jgi:hypothetical protein
MYILYISKLCKIMYIEQLCYIGKYYTDLCKHIMFLHILITYCTWIIWNEIGLGSSLIQSARSTGFEGLGLTLPTLEEFNFD